MGMLKYLHKKTHILLRCSQNSNEQNYIIQYSSMVQYIQYSLLTIILSSSNIIDKMVEKTEESSSERVSWTSKCQEYHLRVISEEIVSWESLVPFLGLNDMHRNAIMKDYPRHYTEQKYQLLLKWKQLNGKDATFENFLNCISESRNELLKSTIKSMVTKFLAKPLPPSYDEVYPNLPTSKCTQVHLRTFCRVLCEWESLVPYLGLEEADKRVIIHCHPHDYERQKHELFVKWQEKYQDLATYHRLMSSLIKANNKQAADALQYIATTPLNLTQNQYFSTSFTAYRKFLQLRYDNLTISASADESLSYVSSEYINLTLVKLGQDDDAIVGSVEDVITHHECIKLNELLNFPAGRERICLIEGGPGMGKTTLAMQICKLWSKGIIFNQYSALILLALRNPPLQEAKSVKDFLLTLDEKMKEGIFQEITRTNGENVCFIFEGFDELPLKLRKHPLFSKLTEDLPKCTALYTSRPESCQNIKRRASQRIQILGFNLEQAYQYIHTTLEPKQTLKNRIPGLIKTIENNSTVQNLLNVPINVAIIIHLYITVGSLPDKITELYTLLCIQLILRYVNLRTCNEEEIISLRSLNHLPEDVRLQFKQICYIAYEAILRDKIYLTADAVNEILCNATDNINGLGLLVISIANSPYGVSKMYNFLHLTVQEFCAAWHISQLSKPEQCNIFTNTYHSPRFHVMWQFFAGITHLVNEKLFHKMVDFCNIFVQSWSTKLNIARVLVALHEANNSKLSIIFGDHLKGKINFSYYQVDSRCCSALGYFLQYYGNRIRKLNLFSSNVGDAGLEVILNGLLRCKPFDHGLKVTLDIARNNLTKVSSRIISSVITTIPSLQTLILDHNYRLSTGVCDIASKAMSSSSLRELSLYYTSADHQVFELLSSQCCKVSSLEMSRNELSIENLNPLSNKNISLLTIKLNQCLINKAEFEQLCSIFMYYTCLQFVELQNNAIGDQEFVHLLSFLKSNVNMIRSIDLSNNEISCEGIRLFESILLEKSSNISIRAVNFAGNPLEDEGVDLLMHVLFATASLENVNISQTLATTKVNSSIARVLYFSTSLKSFAFTPTGSCSEVDNEFIRTSGYLKEITLVKGSTDGIETVLSTCTDSITVKSLIINLGSLTSCAILYLLKMLEFLATLKLINVDILSSDIIAIGKAIHVESNLKFVTIWPARRTEHLNEQQLTQFIDYLYHNCSLKELTLWINTEVRGNVSLIHEVGSKVTEVNHHRGSNSDKLHLYLRPF